MVATERVLLLHIPPPGASVAVSADAAQSWLGTETGPNGFTVTVFAAKHPGATTYDITVVPRATPVTRTSGKGRPGPGLTVATATLLLLHIPPATESFNAAVFSWHITSGPKITAGNGCTVTIVVAKAVAQLLVTA